MFRTRAVRQLLLEDIACLQRGSDGVEDGREQLARVRKRAITVVILDWVALLILVFVRARSGTVLALGPTEDSIFTLGILLIAVHSGFRLGQLEKLAAVGRALCELEARGEGPANSGRSA